MHFTPLLAELERELIVRLDVLIRQLWIFNLRPQGSQRRCDFARNEQPLNLPAERRLPASACSRPPPASPYPKATTLPGSRPSTRAMT